MSGLYNIAINTASLQDGHTIAAYLTSASGTLFTNTTIGAKEHLDTKSAAEILDSAAYATGVDYLQGIGVVNSAGNWVPFTLNAFGELPVATTIDMPGDYAEDAAHVSGDIGLFNLSVRRDARSSGTDTNGDYAAFNTNAVGELWTKDADTLAELVLIKGDTAAIASSTSTTATNTSTIAATLTALSKAEDAVHVSGDLGIQALAVRKDTQGSNAADGDYTSLQTWSEGSLKVVDTANGSLLQQQVIVANTATALPTTSLASRKTLRIQNSGAASFWVGSTTVTTSGATAGIEIPKASFVELEVGPAVTVYGRTASGTGNANILETA